MRDEIVPEEKISAVLKKTAEPSSRLLSQIFKKIENKNGLELEEVRFLVNLKEPEQIQELFRIASQIKEEIFGFLCSPLCF